MKRYSDNDLIELLDAYDVEKLKLEEKKTGFVFFIVGIFFGILGNFLVNIVEDFFLKQSRYPSWFILLILLFVCILILTVFWYLKKINIRILKYKKRIKLYEDVLEGKRAISIDGDKLHIYDTPR